MNPYWDLDFFSFLMLLFTRAMKFCMGGLSHESLANDELQVVVLMAIGCSAALLGPFLVLKRMTMTANALSHTSLLGIVSSYLVMRVFSKGEITTLELPVFLMASFITALFTMILINICRRVFKLQEEASIGLIFTSLFAMGIILVVLYTKSIHLGSEMIMGSSELLQMQDLKTTSAVALVNAILISFCFNYYKILSFDVNLAKHLGCAPLLFEYALMIQTALTAISAFRAVGVFLFLIFLTAPTLSLRLFTHRISMLIIGSVVMNILLAIISVALSRHLLSVYGLAVSTGALTSVCIALSYPCALGLAKIRARYVKTLQRKDSKEKPYESRSS